MLTLCLTEFEPAETLADAQALAARRGLAVPRAISSRFPVFVFSKDKLHQTPLRSPTKAAAAAPRNVASQPPPSASAAVSISDVELSLPAAVLSAAAPLPLSEPPSCREIVDNTATQCAVCLCEFEDGEIPGALSWLGGCSFTYCLCVDCRRIGSSAAVPPCLPP